MRRHISLFLPLVLTLILTCCGGGGEAEGGIPKNASRMGSSPYYMVLPDGLRREDVSDGDSSRIASWFDDETQLRVEVYQWEKEGYPDALDEFVQQEAEEHDDAEVVTGVEFNGIPAAGYRYVPEEGDVSSVIVYAFESDGDYIELSFTMGSDAAGPSAAAILNSLAEY